MATANPYEAPQSVDVDVATDTRRASDYRAEARPVLLCLVLAIVTLGFYPAIWLLRRRPFLNALDTSSSLSSGLAIFAIVANVVSLGLVGFGQDGANLARFVGGFGELAVLLGAFRVATMLRSDFARSGRGHLGVSGVLTFFFGIFYLQYKINRAAEVPGRLPKNA